MTSVHVATDLRSMLGPVRDQGARPTCLAFAASDCHAALRPGWIPLSSEYIFYRAQIRANRPPTVGATLSAMLDALRHDGQPEEARWRYLQTTPANVAEWHPPKDAAPVFRRESLRRGNKIDDVIDELVRGRPVLLLMTLSNSFDMADADGVVSPGPSEQLIYSRRHAVVAVGHGEVDGRRVVLVRNSWGSTWGNDGHAWLTEQYLLPRLFALTVLMEDPDVSPNTTAA